MNPIWNGLNPEARRALTQRDYSSLSLAQRLGTTGVEAAELLSGDRSVLSAAWIPGVEVFARSVYPQRHRGTFGEFGRKGEGTLGTIGLWPQQWATARMFAGTAKGFHIHPPHLPDGQDPISWFRRLYVEEAQDMSLRPYEREQWDVMFFIQGSMEIFLIDERAGLERRVMRFLIEGDERRGPNNAGVVIPAGVAHAIRVEGTTDGIMVYGTSTKFNPEFEGRMGDSLERPTLPPDWEPLLKTVDSSP